MKEKFKKAAVSLLYRSIVCLSIFCVMYTVSRFFPQIWKKAAEVIGYAPDMGAVGKNIYGLLREIVPFRELFL